MLVMLVMAVVAVVVVMTVNLGRFMYDFKKKVIAKLVGFLSREEKCFLDKAIHQNSSELDTLYSEPVHYFYWENQIDSWGVMPSPVRPSHEEIESYARLLENKNTGNALILGSTPELRDLLAKRPSANVHLADFTCRMPLAMLKHTQNVDAEKEIWVKANWLNLPFPEKFFDVILGDLALQQFTPELEGTFLQKISSLLKPEGIFILRAHFLEKAMQSKDAYSIMQDVLSRNLTNYGKFISLKLNILWLFADPENRNLHRLVSAEHFDRFVKSRDIEDPIVKRVRDALIADKDSYRSWSPPTEEVLMKKISSVFTINEILTAGDYEESRVYPIFSLTPRN